MRDSARREVVCVVSNVGFAPPFWMELAYYALTVYGIMAVAWGISVRLAAAAGLGLLAAACLVVERRATAVHHALAAPLLCALTFMAIQVGVHGESLASGFTVSFISWMLSVIVLQSLMLRPGFLHRFALVCFAIGLMVLPYLTLTPTETGVVRVGLDRAVSLSNPNDLGAWLGFCAVYFITLGIETRRLPVRIVAWTLAGAALLIVGLTVSRGPLLSVAIVTVVAFRRTLKSGFLPALLFISGLWVAFGLGVFDQMLGYYSARGTVETGRLAVWPLVIERIVHSPLIGVGISHLATYVPEQAAFIIPHNTYLFFPLASGVVPFGFFLAYVTWAVRKSIYCQAHPELRADEPFRFPLLLYLLLSCGSLDFPFAFQWGTATLCLAMSVVVSRPMIRATHLEAEGRLRSRAKYA